VGTRSAFIGVIAALTVAGSVQTWSLVSSSAAGPVPLLPGDEIALNLFQALGFTTEPASCWEAFLLDPMCPACNAVADRYGNDPEYDGWWVVGGKKNIVSQFVSERGIPPDRVLWLEGASGLGALREIGVFGVPSRIVVTAEGIVGDIRLARTPASEVVRAAACDAG
jgi:hypothetical protein